MQDHCAHLHTTSTVALGPHCADCREPLVSMFSSISRNTLAGKVLYAMRQQPAHSTNTLTPTV